MRITGLGPLVAAALAAAALTCAAPAAAAGFEQKGGQVSLAQAGITLPEEAGTLRVAEVKEFSHQGKGIDNVAQYRSPDGKVEATVYVYMPAYADAALAAAKTSEVVEARFGPGLVPAASAVVPAGGVEGAAIRRVYESGMGGVYTTSLAILKAGRWIVKMRASAPTVRGAEAVAALDALLQNIRFSERSAVAPAAQLQLSDCPVRAKKARKVTPSGSIPGLEGNPLAAALIASVAAAPEEAAPVAIAGNGSRPLCVRERVQVGDSMLSLVQPAGGGERPDAVIAVVNDAGATFEMRKAEDGKNYMLMFHQIGETAHMGLFNRPLSGEQLASILTGKASYPIVAETHYTADGKVERTINVNMGK